MTIKWNPEIWGQREGRKGEKRNKLTAEQAAEIRARGGKRNNAALAREFGISPTLACDIVAGRRWKVKEAAE